MLILERERPHPAAGVRVSRAALMFGRIGDRRL